MGWTIGAVQRGANFETGSRRIRGDERESHSTRSEFRQIDFRGMKSLRSLANHRSN